MKRHSSVLTLSCLLCVLTFVSLGAEAKNVFLNPSRGFEFDDGEEGPVICADTEDWLIRSVTLDNKGGDFDLSLTIRDLRPSPTQKYAITDEGGHRTKRRHCGWQLLLCQPDDDKPILSLQVTPQLTRDMLGAEKYSLGLSLLSNEGDTFEGAIGIGLRPIDLSRIMLRRRGDTLYLRVGTGEMTDFANIPFSADIPISKLLFELSPAAEIELLDFAFIDRESIHDHPCVNLTEIATAIDEAEDTRAGYWTLTGYSFDEKRVRNGGNYNLAIIPDDAGGFRIYYLGGARIRPDEWKPGMLKATLSPTADDNFSASWIDAEGHTVGDAVALFSSRDDITFYFPTLDNAQVTLRRNSAYQP